LNGFGFQARKGHPDFMFQLGAFYYYGLRGVRRDHSKALVWLLKAVEKGETRPYELIGEIYARGYGVERNYTKALEWFKAAAERKQFSALNGIGFLYIKGLGVDAKNYTKVCVSPFAGSCQLVNGKNAPNMKACELRLDLNRVN
jgi:SEL1 protein